MDGSNKKDRKENEDFLKLQRILTAKPVLDETCILHQSLTLIANKWTMLILMALMEGTKRNSEIQRQISGISPKMLTQTLKMLISYDMVSRQVYPEVPPRVEYQLTDFGKSTAGPLLALLDWSLAREAELGKLYHQQP